MWLLKIFKNHTNLENSISAASSETSILFLTPLLLLMTMENWRPNFGKSLAKLNIASSTTFHKQTNKLQDYPIHKADLRAEISIPRNTINIMLHKHGFSLQHCYTLYARIVYIDWQLKLSQYFITFGLLLEQWQPPFELLEFF